MKFSRCYTFVCCALAGWVLSEPTAAMSLGRLRGAAVLGQPMALTIPLQSNADEDVSGLCVGADVYFGESAVESSHVTARLDGAGAAAVIRVSVRKPVDEPIVTLYLKTGCQQQTTRKYVLLSDFSSEIQPAVVPLAADPVPRTANARPVASEIASPATPLPAPASPGRRVAPNRAVADATAISQPGPAVPNPLAAPRPGATASPKPVVPKKRVATGAGRLELLPLELTQEWEPSLRSTNQLSLPAGEADIQKRLQAAALWRAISASPEEILQEAGKRAALQAELRDLVASSQANQLAIAALNNQLQAAHAQRVRNPVVYVLLALLAACGAALVYARSGRFAKAGGGAPWWQGAGEGGGAQTAASQWREASGGAADPLATKPDPAMGAPASVQPAPASVDIPLSDSVLPAHSTDGIVGAGPTGSSRQLAAADSRPTDFTHSHLGALRAINTHEMVDARQQADFFVALGQHDEAVSVLYGALSQGSESNPHIYLDLIALLHKLSRKDDYEKLRLVFNALYTCHLPAYGAYAGGRGLLEYPDLLQPLVSLWASPVAVEYVVKCLVRDDTDSADCAIDREAFEDLLLLHGILGSVVNASAPPDAMWTCPARVLPTMSTPAQPFLPHQDVLARGVDFDLSTGH